METAILALMISINTQSVDNIKHNSVSIVTDYNTLTEMCRVNFDIARRKCNEFYSNEDNILTYTQFYGKSLFR